MSEQEKATAPEVIKVTGEAPSRFSGAVGISDKAAEKLHAFITAEKKDPAKFGLRIAVEGGGCSGLQYKMDFDEARPDDKVYLHEAVGVHVIVDAKSALHVSGSILDYTETLMASGFALKNPNVTGSCGCGESFST